MSDFKLVTLDPGHFHAALVQKQMYPGVDPRVHVYAPLGSDLAAHLQRIARFNERPIDPTSWELEVHAGTHFFNRMIAEKAGNVAVLSGRNRGKIQRILSLVGGGFHVLADKPWIIGESDLPVLDSALQAAAKHGVFAFDIMTERYEITSILQRELVNDPAIFGEPAAGSVSDPGVYMESVHHIRKLVAGVPNLRPAWFFDIAEQGEALADVGTHLVDLVQWTLSPERPVHYGSDIRILGGKRWPTTMTREQLREVTGESQFPAKLDYYCNNQVDYTLRGIHVRLDVLWNYGAPEGGGDTHYAVYRGTRALVAVRQGKAENYVPELYVMTERSDVHKALRDAVARWQASWPGVALEEHGQEVRVTIPDRYRVGHEAHFGEVANRFFGFLRGAERYPEWETAAMLAKYYVTTAGVAAAHA